VRTQAASFLQPQPLMENHHTLSSTKGVIIDDRTHQTNPLHNNFTATETNHIPLITTFFN
jgi:hypothetical protein